MLSRMILSMYVPALVTALALDSALSTPSVAAKSTIHHDSVAQVRDAARPKVPAHRWASDAVLRAGMRNLREATEALHHYKMGHLDDVQRDNAVEKIDAAIRNMIANCKLEPQADAALHGLLATFIVGANAVRAGTFGTTELVSMQEALAQYPQLFDDAQWSQPAE